MILESGKEVCSVFFDLKKAFDTVPHQPLISKLERTGLSPHILEWIKSYLTERQQRVVVGGEFSNNIPVLSGLPQGSVLGPLLFLIYTLMIDITELQLSCGSVLNLYADDMLLYKAINSDSDYQSLQNDVNRIQEWVTANHLSLNSSKCKWMLVTRKRNTPCIPLYLGSAALEKVESFKYLGVLLIIIIGPNLDTSH